MNTHNGNLHQQRNISVSKSITKLNWLAQALRLLSALYAIWVLVRIFRWWTNSELVIKNMGQFLGRDLTDLSVHSRMMAMTLDLVAWLLLLAAVVYCWRSLGYLIQEHALSRRMAQHLTQASWLGGLCQILSLAARPVQTYLMTSHLPVVDQVFKWTFYPQDLLSFMLCGVIACFAYLIYWAEDIAEENRGFI